MTAKPYRLSTGGRLIDRARKIHFSFDGKPMTGFAGDTVASAVLANGQRVSHMISHTQSGRSVSG